MYRINKKIISILIIVFLILSLFINFILVNKVEAKATRNIYTNGALNQYAGYETLIANLKQKHPNWNFKILYTGLNWNNVLKGETAVHSRNLITSSKTGAWICPICGTKSYDATGRWYCASEATVAYYMDPRNSLDEQSVFQFEELSFNSNTQSVNGVSKIISGITWMQGNTVSYIDTNGETNVIEKSYAQIIYDAARNNNISAYHLAARIKQEQGYNKGPLISGTYGDFVGYYNYLNIGASGNGNEQIITNGLTNAKNKGWTNPELSINGGASIIASNYIAKGQDTLYLQKFDVDDSDPNGSLYAHQYMQNVSASKSEASTVYNTYNNLGMLDYALTFVIPVFEDMPTQVCSIPNDATPVTQNVIIQGTNVRIRSSASTEASIVESNLNNGYELLRIEIGNSSVGGYKWDKVVLPDGRMGYVATNYLKQVEDKRTANDSLVTTTKVNLRNGPGITGTITIDTLLIGQAVTRIECGAYNLDGYIWDRVILNNGLQGYIATNYLTTPEVINVDRVQVICNSGLKIRKNPGTSENILAAVAKGTVLTRTQKEVSNANGYIWDKVVTDSGIEGYIARGDSNEAYIQVYQEQLNTTQQPESQSAPTYSKGDANGDSIIDSSDLLTVKKHLLGKVIITDESKINAADVNGDGVIDSADLLKIKKYLLGKVSL